MPDLYRKYEDLVLETTDSTGIGALKLLGAVNGYQSFELWEPPEFGPAGFLNEIEYTLWEPSTGYREWGIASLSKVDDDYYLSRDDLEGSTYPGGAKIDLQSGIKQVWATINSSTLTLIAAMRTHYYWVGKQAFGEPLPYIFVFGPDNAINNNATGAFYNSTQCIIGSVAGDDITTGEDNLIVGSGSAQNLVTGSRNVMIGNSFSSPATDIEDAFLVSHLDPLVGPNIGERRLIWGSFEVGLQHVSPGNDDAVSLGVDDGGDNIRRWKTLLTNNDIEVGAVTYIGTGGSDSQVLHYNASTGATYWGDTLTFSSNSTSLIVGSEPSVTGLGNCALGIGAGDDLTVGSGNSFFGYNSGTNVTGSSGNSFFGRQSGQNVTGSNNTLFGYQTGLNITSGISNVFLGYKSGNHLGNVSSNLCIGWDDSLSETWLTGDENGNVVAEHDFHIKGKLTVSGNIKNITEADSTYSAANGELVLADIDSDTIVDLPATPNAGNCVTVRLYNATSGAKLTVNGGSNTIAGNAILYIGDTTRNLYDEIVFWFDGVRWQTIERLQPHFDILTLSGNQTTNSASTMTDVDFDTSSTNQVGNLRSTNTLVIKRSGKYAIDFRARPYTTVSDQQFYEGYVRVNGTHIASDSTVASGTNPFVNAKVSLVTWLAANDVVKGSFQCAEVNKGVGANTYSYLSLMEIRG